MSEEEIKKSRKKKPKVQEEHYDDCGSDTITIEEDFKGVTENIITQENFCFADHETNHSFNRHRI